MADDGSRASAPASPTRPDPTRPERHISPAVDLDARQGETGGYDEPPESILRARRRAQAPEREPAWSGANCRRVVERAAVAASPWDVPLAEDRQEAWDRLEVLAALDETRSPGRLLDPVGWEVAGRELARIRRDAANRAHDLAAREARDRGAVGCEHGHPLGGARCSLCRAGIAEPTDTTSAPVEVPSDEVRTA